jgi:hypothetical protein
MQREREAREQEIFVLEQHAFVLQNQHRAATLSAEQAMQQVTAQVADSRHVLQQSISRQSSWSKGIGRSEEEVKEGASTGLDMGSRVGSNISSSWGSPVKSGE